METRRITRIGLSVALALILSYVESQIPAFFSIPGIKIGLSNLAVVFSLYTLSFRDTLLVSFFKVFISSLLFGSVVSLLYSLSGALLSLFGMVVMKKTRLFGVREVSVVGAILHNMAQIATAIVILGTSSIKYYIPFLIVSGTITGFFIGIISSIIIKRMENDYSLNIK